MAKNQIDMSSVSLPSVPKPPTQQVSAGFDFNNQSSRKRRQNLMGEMPEMSAVESNESQTAAGRLEGMLESGSPLMERARTQGLQTANSRGLLNSSMAAGAAQGAMIDRAQPFALQDSNNLMQNARQDAAAQNEQAMLQSSTLADSFLNNQQFQQQGALNQQNYDIQSGLAQQQAGLQAQRAAQGYAYDRGMAGYQADLQAARDERLAGLDQDMARLQSDLTEARAQNDFGREQQILDQQAAIQQERDQLLFGQQRALSEQEFGQQQQLTEQQADIQAQRDQRLSEIDQQQAELESELQRARDNQLFGQEQQLIDQQAALQTERDRLLADQQAERDQRIASLDQQQTRLQAELNEAAAQNDFGRQQQLTEQQAQIQAQRDELLFEQDLDRTAQEYGLRADEIAQEGQQAMERLYGTSLANAWGVMGNNVTDIVAQSLIEINDIQNNPNIEPEDKTEMIEQIQAARDADVEFQAELYSSFPDTLQNSGVFPSVG